MCCSQYHFLLWPLNQCNVDPVLWSRTTQNKDVFCIWNGVIVIFSVFLKYNFKGKWILAKIWFADNLTLKTDGSDKVMSGHKNRSWTRKSNTCTWVLTESKQRSASCQNGIGVTCRFTEDTPRLSGLISAMFWKRWFRMGIFWIWRRIWYFRQISSRKSWLFEDCF